MVEVFPACLNCVAHRSDGRPVVWREVHGKGPSVKNSAAKLVYIVDDEPKIRKVLGQILERAGITISRFGSAEECLAALRLEPCDLLITDVRMPEKDGMELLLEARTLLPWLPVLVVTGFGDVPMAIRAMKMGATDFIEKPLDRDTFLQAVQNLLARSAAQSALLRRSLTRMEMKVLRHILDGRNNREIADVLHRSARTVEVHRRHLMQKMGANNIVELLRQAAGLYLFDTGPSVTRPAPRTPPA
jgi:two-component system response regulator FixJ